MQDLLTDDELVALSSATGAMWPFPLRTVGASEGEVTAAALRGLRSLTVRGLAEAASEHGARIAADLASTYSRAVSAPKTLIAHVSGVEPVSFEGAAVVVFIDDQLVLDTVTVAGIHAFGDGDRAKAIDAVEAFVLSRFDGEGADAYCVIVATSADEKAFRVGDGVIEWGRVVGDADGARFEVHGSAGSDVELVRQFVRRELS